MDDRRIVAMYLAREEQALEVTAQKYGGYCKSIAMRILESEQDADECVNDTWLRIWNSIPPHMPKHLKAFLAKITRNLAFDRYRRQTAQKRGSSAVELALEELEACLPANNTPEAEYRGEELKQSINRFLRALPERDCNIFLRRYFYTEEIGEIAERYGLKQENVRLILSRTRKKLKNHLEKEDFTV
ncbi:MAG: sigma-70 family RNA polymerase sigma factor [Clostridia bacterium]|nr:sigma-70 family RNA polymerase sigma factor [Clostridia bacterium]